MNDKQLDNANLENLTLLWKLMGATKCPVIGMDKFLLSYSWPYRCWPETRPAPADIASINKNIHQLKKTTILPILSIADATTRQLEKILKVNGFEIAFEQTAMYLDMNTYNSHEPSNLIIKTISSKQDIERWTDIASVSFDYAIDVNVIDKIAPNPDIRLVTAHINNRPVATAMLFKSGTVMGIHQVGVLPVDRGQGIAAHLMNDILLLCRQSGAEYITLQASPTAIGLYEKSGFTAQYKIRNYQRIPDA